jgi:hypothetical protein
MSMHCRFLPSLARTALEDAMKGMNVNKITMLPSEAPKEINITGI